MKLFRKDWAGIRIWRFEFYKVISPRKWFEYHHGPCGCYILEIFGYGVAFLLKDCYTKADEEWDS